MLGCQTPPLPPRPGRHPLGTRQTPPDQADTPPDQADPTLPGTRQIPPGPGRPPRNRQTPPRTSQTPPEQANTPPPPRSRLQHTVYERPVRILLECILVTTKLQYHQQKKCRACDFFWMSLNSNYTGLLYKYSQSAMQSPLTFLMFLNVFKIQYAVADPGFSRGGGVNPPGGAWTRQIFPKTAWNRKNLDAQGGACVPHAPP